MIGEEVLGRFKAATIYQDRSRADQAALAQLGLELTPARLQELFICLTGGYIKKIVQERCCENE